MSGTNPDSNTDAETNSRFSRRAVLQGGAGALVVAFGLTSASKTTVATTNVEELSPSLEEHPEIDSWIIVEEDGTVTVQTGKVELGQGIKTAIAQVAADELDVDFERVTIVTAETETTPDEGYTAGSQSMEHSASAVTYAAAEARQYLLEEAGDELEVEPEELTVEDGTITGENGEETTYWDLLGGESFEQDVTADVETKDPDEKVIVGESAPRVDVPDKVTGGVSYVHDLRVPDMLHGRVVRPPGYDAELTDVDEEEVADMDGVIEVVRDGNFLGVVADGEWQAIQAMEALEESAEWEVEETLPEQDDLYEFLREEPSDETIAEEEGDVEDALEDAAQTLEAEYLRPYQLHASIGPSCAVAEFEEIDQERHLNVWTHSQGVYPLREALSDLLDLSEEEITCTHMEGSGCYGHNGADDVAADAALLSEAVDGQPVRVQWMREDEHQWEPTGSAMVMESRGGLDDDGTIVGWEYDVWSYPHSTRPPGQPLLAGLYVEDALELEENTPIPLPTGGGTRNSVPLYDFENVRVNHHFLPEPTVRVSALRGLGAYANVFALESFVDELAAGADEDPVEFRLRHMGDERARDVIEAAAEEAEWDDRELEDDQGQGIAFAQYKNLSAYTAIVVDVTVDSESGEVSVDRAVAANDSGEIVNPNGIRHQIGGGIIQSTSWTLHEAVDFDAEGVTDADWSDYPILTFPEMPDVEITLLDRPGEPYLGTGEASQGPTAAAIANAIYDATGARVRELPLTPDRVQEAIDDDPDEDEEEETDVDDDPDEEEDTDDETIEPGEILLDGYTQGWEGVEPEGIEGEENPTLVLEEGEAYELTWENADGDAHNVVIRDDDGEVVDDYETELLSEEGETQTLEFEASDEMVEYVCEPHLSTMTGEIDVR